MNNYKSDFLNHINERGFIYQISDSDKLDKLFSEEKITAYIGFDCTAPNLHIGSLMQILLLKKLQDFGHTPIVLIGGATSKIGDPSLKDKSRKMLSYEDINNNVKGIKKVFEKNDLAQKLNYSEKREQHASEEVNFLGECESINSIRMQVEKISALSQSESGIPPTILILGETGTGKDVVARLMHSKSSLSKKPFVHVDCASLPKDLIESELFGHEKGAFTNANASRAGLIEAAEDGVLFLDAIAEIPIDLQSKLLAVLERRSLRRLGSTKERPIAAWIIAATNRDIQLLVDSGEFRSDLYYRLNVISLTMPALRERDNDVILLANYCATMTSKRYSLEFDGFTDEAIKLIKNYSNLTYQNSLIQYNFCSNLTYLP